MLKLIVSLFIGLISYAAQADTLWGKAEYGASAAEIAKIFPEGVSVTPTEKNRLPSGAYMLYQIEKVGIAEKVFSPEFYFLEDKLTKVILTHKSNDNVYSCEHTAESLQEALRAKYGTELKNTRTNGLGLWKDVSWASGKTTINLVMIAYDLPKCTIFVTYSAKNSEAGDKL